MAHGPSSEPIRFLEPEHEARLLEIAVLGVRHAAAIQALPHVDPAREPPALQRPGATFVTLKREGRLRGCIGTLEATRPLAEDVAYNAFAAARHDPRFPPLTTHEISGLELSVAALGAQEPLAPASREALLEALRPGIDGLVVRSGMLRATFLPAVWEQLPDPGDFVAALWEKARLPAGAWPGELRLSRYRVYTLNIHIADHGPL
ncbi:AMMECR1 domain protein [Thioalkalivibrio nitratireducens DSM 14787]|uniref:AMMECR1 domain protein n=1 Tax=Thioalkalivibrio nitratireducens (strain DSM 14787 / UNIQEM 213 / ALEN2) TaxID=1255043 RepID=L0DVE7_THIND|nr:AmmeMemoRadiSam system protein A [Thioalkalivibrio nitratireducens]AGA32982.1 AMMECR1 domain protein [Thioalkalivibrio nitratireducens DSM 14787]